MRASIRSQSRPYRSAWDVFCWPLVISGICGVGLGLALVGDGIWDGLSWLALSSPVVLTVFYWHRAGRRR